MSARARLARFVRRPDRDERGATALFVAILMTLVLLVVSAFAIDLGMQRAGRRDMQAVADMVALDMGRLIDGRTRAQIEAGGSGEPSASSQLSYSIARNTGDAVGGTPTVKAYWVKVNANGTYASAGGVPVQVASGDVPNGVVVTADTSVSFAFGAFTGTSSGDVARSAVATAEESACFSLGSYAARLDTSASALLNPILNGILGGGANLDVLSYTGLVKADVSLLDIALDLGLGSVDELLSSNINAGTFLIAAAHVLAADGNSNANILNLVAAKLGGVSLNLANLVSAEPGAGAAETATINALDLLTGTILLANGTNALSIPALATNLPLSGTGLTTSLSLIEKARHRCGKRGSTANTSQVALSVNGNILSSQSVLGLPVTGTTAISVTAASAKGVLTDIICGSETAADPSGEDVQVTSGAVGASAQLNLSLNGSTSGSANIDNGLISGILSLLNLLGLNKIASITISGSIGLKVSTGDPSTIKTAQIRVPNSPVDWDHGVSTGSGDIGLNTAVVTVTSNTLSITAKNFLGLPVNINANLTAITNNLVSSLTSKLLNPLVTALNDNVLHPLYDILGLTVAGADVYGEKPYCSNPLLVG